MIVAGRIGERHRPETHVVPLAIQSALGLRGAFTLFGDDYDTRDGTAVRDYVHVQDLADAHVQALRHLLAGGESVALNLGTGTGSDIVESAWRWHVAERDRPAARERNTP